MAGYDNPRSGRSGNRNPEQLALCRLLEWNRCSYIKDPATGKRVARPNPKDLWEVVGVPDLRIAGHDLWDAVKLHQNEQSYDVRRDEAGNPLNRAHRRKFLCLSGLSKPAGFCGGGYTIVAQERYGCATRRSRGTCENHATIGRQEIELRVLGGLKKLMAPELVREFVRAFQEEVNQALVERERLAASRRSELAKVERKIAGIVTAIEDGRHSRVLSDRLTALEREQEELQASVAEAPTPIVPHSSAAGRGLCRQGGLARGNIERSPHPARSHGSAALFDFDGRAATARRRRWRGRRAARRLGSNPCLL